MRGTNHTSVSEFLLLGLSMQPQHQPFFFMLFLSMYLTTVLGNLLIVLAISADSRLHTPMYYFLGNLSFVDVCFSSTTVPKMLINNILSSKTISFSGCLTQHYFLIVFADVDNFLLAIMAYDRFVAVCHPLHYTTKMTHQLCALLLIGSWIVANANALLHTLLMIQLSFCADNTLPHFFCDVSLLKLSCSDTYINDMMIFIVAGLILIAPFVCILISYILIACAVLRVPTTKGKLKAFSTCGSHLAVVLLFYGTIIALYFSPSSSYSVETDTAATVMYTIVTPMLNPFIYSLRNKDMKGALRKIITMKIFSVQY